MTDLVKPQVVRVLDVFLIGPLMIWGGLAARSSSNLAGFSLAGLGLVTIWYNHRNLRRIHQAERPGGSINQAEPLPGQVDQT